LEFKELDVVFCGAPIGRGKKMCTKDDCDVVSHRKVKVAEDAFGGGGGQVFIQVPATAGRTDSTSVYLTPRLSTDLFDARLGMYLSEECTVDQWTSLFASIEATPNPTSEEKDIIAG
jgi:hypothetical protein